MNLVLPVLFNTIAVILVYLEEKHIAANRLPRVIKQLLIGILFGLLSIYASEHGIDYEEVTINVRDAAPLCAGLVFGAPAGIISGLMGGLYRYFIGAGDFTRLACSIATISAGVLAGILRKIMFDNKKPTWGYGVGIAVVMEDIHMLLIFLLKLDDAAKAFRIVQQATIPMAIGNAVAAGIALFAVSLLSGDFIRNLRQRKERHENIIQTFQRWLLICILIAYVLTSIFTYQLQTNTAETQTEETIEQAMADVQQDIIDACDDHLLETTRELEAEYLSRTDWTSEALAELAAGFGVADINIFDSEGIILNSSNAEFIGFDMSSGEQSSEFMCLFNGKSVYIQGYQPLSYDESISRKYAGVRMSDGTALQVGYSFEEYTEDIYDQVNTFAKNRHIGTEGFLLILDDKWRIVGNSSGYTGVTLDALGLYIDEETMDAGEIYTAEIRGTDYLYSYLFSEGYCIIGAIPESEANYMRDVSVYVSALVQIIIFATLFVMVYFLVKTAIINNLQKINTSLSRITGGDLSVKVDVRSSQEFMSLSDDINSTVSTLKRYIAEAESRIDQELEYAKQIQYSALPSVFPPYPDQKRFDIYAQMHTAKEVGGDFYDFYLLDEDTLAFLIADVSGKGIPASLFMMRAKTTIMDLAEQRLPVNEILAQANDKLCEGNDAGMFVTACMGIIDLRTGKLQLANAGHNPPLVLHGDGSWEYLKLKAGFVLAGMEGVPYRLHEITMGPGDRFYLYTDGVTEATDARPELYGEERLLHFMNAHTDTPPDELLTQLKEDIDLFVGEAPQFDDITMLIFDYHGEDAMKKEEKTFPAEIGALPEVQEFFESALEKVSCPMKVQVAVSIAIEEVFVNVAHYAYPGGTGEVTAVFDFDPDSRTATFVLRDRGVPFDPLSQEDPDVTLTAEDRQIGGLGIFITKKTMDSVGYRNEDGENILTMKKII